MRKHENVSKNEKCVCTVNVRKPDVRFFGVFETCPVVKSSGFQTLSEICLLCLVIGRPVHSNSNLWLSDVRFQSFPTVRLIQNECRNRLGTSSKLVLELVVRFETF